MKIYQVFFVVILIFFSFSRLVFATDLYDYSAGAGSAILDNTIGITSEFYGTSGSYGYGGASLPITTPVSFFTIQILDGITCPIAGVSNSITAYSSGGGILFTYSDIGTPDFEPTTGICTYPVSANHDNTFKALVFSTGSFTGNDGIFLRTFTSSDFDLYNANTTVLIEENTGISFQLCDSGGCSVGSWGVQLPETTACNILDVGCYITVSLRYLFTPSQGALNKFSGLYTLFKNKPPFGYLFAINNIVSGVNITETSVFSLESLPILNTYIFTPIRTGMIWVLWVFFAFVLYTRFKHIQL